MRLQKALGFLLSASIAGGFTACDQAERERAKVELTQGLSEFVAVARDDLDRALAEIQVKLEEKLQEERLAASEAVDRNTGLEGDGVEAPEAVIGPDNGPYLFDLLKRKPFLKSWNRLFEGRTDMPVWVEQFNTDRDGVAGPSSTVRLGNGTWIFASVCQPHNCPGSFLNVLFSNDGRHAWAVLIDEDSRTWLGDPEPWMLDVLDRE